jgi:hypothetical protein
MTAKKIPRYSWLIRRPRLLLLSAIAASPWGCTADPTTEPSAEIAIATAGSPCTQTSQQGCTPDGSAVLWCIAGIWQTNTTCEPADTCGPAPDDAKTASCQQRQTQYPELVLACSRAVQCETLWAGSIDSCVAKQGPDNDVYRKRELASAVLNDTDVAELFWPTGLQACLAAAKTCDEALACERPAGTTCQSDKNVCLGNSLFRCVKGQPWLQPCPAPSSCLSGDNSAMCATTIPCTGSESVACVGDTALICPPDASIGVFRDCTALGKVCVAGGSWTENGCLWPSSDACDEASFVDKCDGQTLLRCRDGRIVRENCAVAGEQCTPEYGVASCQPVPTACKDPICLGDRLQFCEQGKPVVMDCASVGLECITVATHHAEILAVCGLAW